MKPQFRVLVLSTLAFMLMFAVWLMFGILGHPIADSFHLSASQVYWLGGVAVLMGAILRLPMGILTGRVGGRNVMVGLLLWTVLPCALVSYCQNYVQLLICAAMLGIAGNSFSVGIAWNSAWFSRETQGTAMGTFGAGNVGASIGKLLAPLLISVVPATGLLGGLIPGGWRALPVIYAMLLVLMAALVFWASPQPERLPGQGRRLTDMVQPLKKLRVWRFGLYYIVVFGAYVALALWLPMYFQEVYGLKLAKAGLLTCLFILPATLLQPLGGYLADRLGARPLTIGMMLGLLLVCVPLSLNGTYLNLSLQNFTALIMLIGVSMGLGKAAVFRYIADYFPKDVGAVGGLVGTLGALGGFFMMPLFGLVEKHGHIRQSAFLVLGALTLCSLFWLASVVTELRRDERAARDAT